MSIARVYTTKGPVRKDGLVCGNCKSPIVKGKDRRRTFAVGFRGYEQTRCMKPECTPSRSELESSAISGVYAAIDGLNVQNMHTVDDFEAARDEVVEACEEVADEYESNEMFEVNEMLQERAETIRSAADELSNWVPDNEAPDEDDERDEDVTYEEAMAAWLEETRDSFQEALNNMEMP